MNNEWNDEVVVDVSESDITVDQAYDATSSNPQSGTAVAQAVAQVQPGTSYSAGDAIAISGDNKISVKVDGTTIGIDSTTKELKSLQSIPTKTSDLQNDSGFITSSSLPTKTSDLQNDSGFITSSSLPTKTSDLQNDSGFITSSSLPTKTSDLQNDSGFITSSSLPTKTSDLQNDSGFITSADIPAQVQADWNESDNQDPSFIKNKPTIPAAAPAPGNMLSVTNSVLNVTTTAGITDIQQVSALPANPVSTVLYLIPEA